MHFEDTVVVATSAIEAPRNVVTVLCLYSHPNKVQSGLNEASKFTPSIPKRCNQNALVSCENAECFRLFHYRRLCHSSTRSTVSPLHPSKPVSQHTAAQCSSVSLYILLIWLSSGS